MAIPFKSPISFRSTVLKENNRDEFEISAAAGTTLMLGPHVATMETGNGNEIALSPSGVSLTGNNISIKDLNNRTIFSSNSDTLTITSPNINITDNNKNILQHNNSQNVFGDPTVRAVLQGYPFYIAGDNASEDVLASDENGITLSNNVKNTNIKGSNIVIDGSQLTVPADTKLDSIGRALESTSIACINDLGFKIALHEDTIWPDYSSLIYIIPEPGSVHSGPIDLLDKLTIKLNSRANTGISTLRTFENISFMFAWKLRTQDSHTIYCLYMKDSAWNVYYGNFNADVNFSWVADNAQFYLITQKI